MSITFDSTKHGYANLWDRATILPSHAAVVKTEVRRITTNRSVFVWVEQHTGVPWWVVACMLYRESNLDFTTYLGNGQKLNKVTTQVPKGRGPFNDFYDGAVDALTQAGLIGIPVAEWTIERALYELERFNGEGYFGHHTNSPYLWSFTSLYSEAKFDTDGHFAPGLVDEQAGCVAILKEMEAQGLVTFTREATPTTPQVPAMTDPVPTTTSHPVTTATPASQIDVASVLQHLEQILTGAQNLMQVPFVQAFLPSQFKWVSVAPAIALIAVRDAESIIATFKAPGGNVPKAIAALLRDMAGQLEQAGSA